MRAGPLRIWRPELPHLHILPRHGQRLSSLRRWLLVIDKVGEVEFGALPLEAHGVNQPGERVGGNAMNPRASIIDGNLVIANIADIRAAPYSIVRLQDQDRVTEVLQLFRRTESRNSRPDDDYVVSMAQGYSLWVPCNPLRPMAGAW